MRAPRGPFVAAPPRRRVVVADDCPVVRQLVSVLLEGCGALLLVAEAESGAAAVAACRRYRPDVLVLDHDLGDVTAVDVVRGLAEQPVQPQVLLHSGRLDVHEVARELGLAGSLEKSRTVELLVASLLRL